MNIENIKYLDNMPIARTNMINLISSPIDLVASLLHSHCNQLKIDFGTRRFKKEPKESSKVFWSRIHHDVKLIIRLTLELKCNEDIKYELVRLQTGEHAFFFINHETSLNKTTQQETLKKREGLISKLEQEHNLSKLIEGLFSLRLKMALIEQTTTQFDIGSAYFNSEIYLNAQYQPSKKNTKGIIEAFKLNVYASEYNELSFSLQKSKFLVEPSQELTVSLDDEMIWFNTASGRQRVSRHLDARDTNLLFFKDQSHYKQCQAYTLNVVMDLARQCLLESNVQFSEITFQATHEVDCFTTSLDETLTNHVYVIDAVNCFTECQRVCFLAYLSTFIPHSSYINKSDFDQLVTTNFKTWQEKSSALILSPIHEQTGSSIQELNGNQDNEFSTFWQAFELNQKSTGKKWDLYTALKIKRLQNWLDEKSPLAPMQGLDLDNTFLNSLKDIAELLKSTPEKNKESSNLNRNFRGITHKIKRLKTELWFKETLLSTKCISPFEFESGHFTAFYIRAPKNVDMLAGFVEIKLDGNNMNIINCGVTQGDEDGLKIEHEQLCRVAKLFNNAFYLYDHNNDVLLTSYQSGRTPKIIGPTNADVIELFLYQEEKKREVENMGEKFSDFEITRSAKPKKNILPYYLAPGRFKNDPQTKSGNFKKHHIYLTPHKDGVYYFVTQAQPANSKIVKQNLIENLMAWDADGNLIDVFTQPVTSAFLNSFTLDMLKSGESSKSSIFVKLAKLLIEN